MSGFQNWSTTAASNATADPAVNWAEGQSPSSVNDSARGMMATLAKWRDDLYGASSGLATGGSSTAYTVTTSSSFASAAVMSGAIFSIVPHTNSGAAPTLAVDSLTARALNGSTGVAIPTGALVSGTPYFVRYVHATTEFIVIGATKAVLETLDIINGTQLTTLATDDTFPVYDTSATANRRILVSDVLKIVNALTADGSPDKTADYVLTYDASASGPKKVLLGNLPSTLPRGYIDGCVISNSAGDTTNDIDIAAGICRDSTNAFDITVSALTKQLDANWVAGTNQGMRNSAVGIANTTYHIYAVAKSDGTQDIYAHTSINPSTALTALQAETGGAGYVYARRIASILRESNTIVGFVQDGDYFRRKGSILSIDVTNPGTSAVSRTLNVPTGLNVRAEMNWYVSSTGGAPLFCLSDLDASDEAPSITAAPLTLAHDDSGTLFAVGGFSTVRTNTSGQIRSRLGYSDASSILKIATLGWFDQRGKNG